MKDDGDLTASEVIELVGSQKNNRSQLKWAVVFYLYGFVLFVLLPCAFAYNVAWAVLNFHVYFSDVISDDTKRNKLYSADKANDTRHTCPARNSVAHER